MPETADTELQFPANFLKSFEISIQRRQNFSISCNNLVKLAMSFSTHHFDIFSSPLSNYYLIFTVASSIFMYFIEVTIFKVVSMYTH